jgi:ATP-dependent helicase/DNAse subunit B
VLHGASRARFFDARELDALLVYAQRMITEAAERIYLGDNGLCPVDGACEYCGYKSVCLWNAGYAGNTQRTPPRFDRDSLAGEAAGEAAR